MTISKNNKMMQHLNYRMKVALADQRVFIGYFLAFDKHMNILLSECEEHRKVRSKDARKQSADSIRTLGLVFLRGEHMISLTVAGPPLKEDDSARLSKGSGVPGPGTAKAAGRGMPVVPLGVAVPPQGLQGNVKGVGGPSSSMMQPDFGNIPQPASPPLQ